MSSAYEPARESSAHDDQVVKGQDTPKALWTWDNQARFSLPWWLNVWLLFLVAVCLASAAFVTEHPPARWVLGGFIGSHLVVFSLSAFSSFDMRRGFVSLMHVLFWSPGWVLCIADVLSHRLDLPYLVWASLLIVVLSVAMLFDLRDAFIYVRYLICRAQPSSSAERGPG